MLTWLQFSVYNTCITAGSFVKINVTIQTPLLRILRALRCNRVLEIKGLAKKVMSDRKEEKEKQEREQKTVQ